MGDPTDEKIELLVRSVLAAVDARLVEVRNDIQTVATDVEQRHRAVLAQLQELELRVGTHASAPAAARVEGDPLAVRMEQATQVLLERFEVMHERTTTATNEHFARIDSILEQLGGSAAVPAEVPAEVPAMLPVTATTTVPARAAEPLPSLDAMNAPLGLNPPTGPVPVAAIMPSSITLPPIPPLTSAPPRDPSAEPSGPIDMSRLADLLSEKLGSLSLPTQLQN